MMAAATAGCASAPATLETGEPGRLIVEPRIGDAAVGGAIAEVAMGMVGTRYRYGGTDPTQGFDCSGLVQYVYAQHGLPMPRDVREQSHVGTEVAADAIQPGDLLFFSTTGGGPSHVAIAIGGDQFVHAPSARGAVRIESLGSSYWRTRYLGARRVIF